MDAGADGSGVGVPEKSVLEVNAEKPDGGTCPALIFFKRGAKAASVSAETLYHGQAGTRPYKGTPGSPVYPSRPTGWTGEFIFYIFQKGGR